MRRRSKQCGGIMVIALAVLAGLIAVLAGAAAVQRTEMKATVNRLEMRRAQLAADAGIQRALAVLSLQDPNMTSVDDEWYTIGSTGNDRFDVGSVSFRMEIVDAASFVNLNTATEQQLSTLPLTTEQIDSLLDWREPSRTARPEGAKDDYYNTLPEPYNAKLRRFDTVDELLQVKGFTAQSLYQPQAITGAQGTIIQGQQDQQIVLADVLTTDSLSSDGGGGKLNVNSAQATLQALVQRAQLSAVVAAAIIQRRTNGGPFTSIGQVLAVPGVTIQSAANILNNLSVSGNARQEGKIDLNTATEPVLNTIPNMTPDLASAIVSRQSTGFNGLGDLTTVPGMTLQLLQQMVPYFSVNTQVFLVRVEGIAGQTKAYREAVVSIESGTPKVLRISTPPFADQATHWGWPADSTNTISLQEGQ